MVFMGNRHRVVDEKNEFLKAINLAYFVYTIIVLLVFPSITMDNEYDRSFLIFSLSINFGMFIIYSIAVWYNKRFLLSLSNIIICAYLWSWLLLVKEYNLYEQIRVIFGVTFVCLCIIQIITKQIILRKRLREDANIME